MPICVREAGGDVCLKVLYVVKLSGLTKTWTPKRLNKIILISKEKNPRKNKTLGQAVTEWQTEV